MYSLIIEFLELELNIIVIIKEINTEGLKFLMFLKQVCVQTFEPIFNYKYQKPATSGGVSINNVLERTLKEVEALLLPLLSVSYTSFFSSNISCQVHHYRENYQEQSCTSH